MDDTRLRRLCVTVEEAEDLHPSQLRMTKRMTNMCDAFLDTQHDFRHLSLPNTLLHRIDTASKLVRLVERIS